jgi:hypothetical protein
VNVGAFANAFQLRDASLTQGSRVQQSGEYRVEIWRVVTDPQTFTFFGRPVADDANSGFVESVGSQVGLKSFDNAFALIYVGFGVFALAVFLALAVFVARVALAPRLSIVEHAWAAALLATFINLMTVNLLTQFAHIFWMGLGLVAAAHQRARDAAEATADVERRDSARAVTR